MSRFNPTVYGATKTFTTALATPRETLLGTPVALPTTEPGTSQITYTVQSSDLPTITPSPISVKYTALLYAGGKNADAASQTVNWRVLKNTVSIATNPQTGVAASNFWTHGYFQFYDVSVGDVLEIRLWASSTNVNYDYYAISIIPTRMNLGTAYMNKDVSYSNYVATNLSSGTPSVNIGSAFNFYPTTSAGAGTNQQFSTNITYGALSWNGTYYSGRAEKGDNNISTSTLTHATSRPYYQRTSVPGTISFREVLR